MSAPLYLQRLVAEAGLVELCHIGPSGRLTVGWYDDAAALWSDAQGMAAAGNLFTTLSRIDRAALEGYLATERKDRPGATRRTPDDVVSRHCRLFFDFDPVRPKGTSSTSAELDEALYRARELARRLGLLGWPTPAIAMSGNGAHLQYRTALPNNREVREQLSAIYTGLAGQLSDDLVDFDRTVRNPARLCALYGTTKRKGPDTPDRPHRMSCIDIPTDWQQVHPRQVALLADFYARRQTPAPEPTGSPVTRPRIAGQGDYHTLDAVRWFTAHGAYIRPLVRNLHAVRCPWSAEHSTPSPRGGSDTIIMVGGDGWPGFFCHHSHCSGRTIRDVMSLWGDADTFCARAWGGRHA